MELTNLESVPGRRIVRHLGLVNGSTVRAKHVGKDFLAGLKNIVGGELRAYTELLTESRQIEPAAARRLPRRVGRGWPA